MDSPILKIENISKSFGDRTILKDLSLNVHPGEILGIIGASGSGKTTLLNIIIGFIRPDSGEIRFQEPNLVANDQHEVYKSIYKEPRTMKSLYGFASQVPSFYEKLTVKENLQYFGELYGLNRETLAANINTLLNLLGLSTSSSVLGKNLSGGMERRLDIACALIHNPKILILDEPTADLDPVLRSNIWKLLEKIRSKGTTIILASHHLSELENLCDRIAILKKMSFVGLGSYDELIDQFSRGHEIRIHSLPGKYEELSEVFQRKLKKKILETNITDHELIISTLEPQNILNEVINILDKQKEKIIEIKLVKPSLDQIFIKVSQEKKQ